MGQHHELNLYSPPPRLRVQRGVPQLLGHHLTQALEPLDAARLTLGVAVKADPFEAANFEKPGISLYNVPRVETTRFQAPGSSTGFDWCSPHLGQARQVRLKLALVVAVHGLLAFPFRLDLIQRRHRHVNLPLLEQRALVPDRNVNSSVRMVGCFGSS
jgi:hypothetical protein